MKKKQRRNSLTDIAEATAALSSKRSQDDIVVQDEDLPSAKQLWTDGLCAAEYNPIQPQSAIPKPPVNPHNAEDVSERVKQPPSTSVFVEPFPIRTAGTPISNDQKESTLSREDLRDYPASCWPLGELDKFQVGKLLMTTGLNSKGRTRWLKSHLAKGKELWFDNRKFLQDLDHLPYGPKWFEDDITIGEGAYRRTHTLFRRNIIEVIQELVGDARFKQYMRYAPERQWSSSKRTSRVYNEMWSGNWWWQMQYLIHDPNGTIIPLILALDKTTLSTMAGGQQAYPVYLTIGNISKNIRRKASKHATVILGYLPVDSFKDVTEKSLRTELRGELLHHSMQAIVEPLKAASRDGVLMWCADGRLRRVYPILAAFVGDWPEQNDVSCMVRSGCPICQQRFHGRGSGDMYKGVFKSYIADWTEEILGKTVWDERFMVMPQAKNLRRETKEMAKQYLPIVADDPAVPSEFVKMVRALLDFLYLAESEQLSEGEIEEMDEALRTFHSLKKVLVELGVMEDLEKFDYIPKFHMLGHYTCSIHELGTPDGYNTESPEHLHIIYAKRGWRASNRREAIKQIIKYRAYIDNFYGESLCLGLEMDEDDGDYKEEDKEDEEDDDNEGLGDDMEEIGMAEAELGVSAYPRPTFSVAVRPTCPRVTGHNLINVYGAIDLINSLARFLKPLARKAGLKPVVLSSNVFDIWHKLTLQHLPTPFAPNESPHCDVVRIRLPGADQHSHCVPGIFDTVLFLHQPGELDFSRRLLNPLHVHTTPRYQGRPPSWYGYSSGVGRNGLPPGSSFLPD
ncbi:hypothetical protein BDV93DRAFT_548345 [Ceratobasidium sp. AG-I]|nr:hypothetical protein BDV93DRAFT_548345 [Ceratobasidium sp. AG-I]